MLLNACVNESYQGMISSIDFQPVAKELE